MQRCILPADSGPGKDGEISAVPSYHFRCTSCQLTAPAGPDKLGCHACGGALVVEYEGPSPCTRALWGSLPLWAPKLPGSMGEGRTPCVPLNRLGAKLQLPRLYAKLEHLNPTGSFKDRGSAVLVSALAEYGVREVADDSSGNAGASLAAYAARAGICCTIFVPDSTPIAKLTQISAYGACLERVPGTRQAAARACREHCSREGVTHASHSLSPFFLEGMKSFSYEVAESFPDSPPDHLLFPVGNGALLIGAWKGITELLGKQQKTAALGARLPRLHAVQAEACSPVVAAYRREERLSLPPPQAPTVTGGIAVERPPRLAGILAVLEGSQGSAVAVNEERVLAWQKDLAETEGIFCEPTAAAAFAGLEILVKDGVIRQDEVVVVPVTGHGLKDR